MRIFLDYASRVFANYGVLPDSDLSLFTPRFAVFVRKHRSFWFHSTPYYWKCQDEELMYWLVLNMFDRIR